MPDFIDWSIIGPAMVAGLLVLSTHVPLGQEVLRRGIVFIDLAIAQVAALGVIAAYALEWDPEGIEVEIAAVSAALIAALGLYWTEKRWSRIQEPLIGTLFILAATGGILLLAGNPHGSEHLKELLVGQILWTTWDSLWPVAILYAIVLALWFWLQPRSGGLLFYLAFAVVVTASVQIVGVYLVFASLIIPALATSGIKRGNRLAAGYAIGAVSYLLGIILSFVWDLPTGAVIVWSMAAVALLAGTLISDKQRPDV
ncbi:MAG: metal ABC transporter permease [Gammaproteobacteria bacterium]|nr:metal ABC transporter permease [Gammaproteobacteria bacterium]NNF48514.1 metal ABC transporter permease [Woeseiaceae bacterium]MBT8093628.1 metal ABC transporter permease [Gammaproteobacteria bacterium]MBT8106310.1 metal ABC transporter permease [Gammaproteobacteria bacterium]NNK26324.1 metal ABC transporter permease [Woeseiaceae bacterium]